MGFIRSDPGPAKFRNGVLPDIVPRGKCPFHNRISRSAIIQPLDPGTVIGIELELGRCGLIILSVLEVSQLLFQIDGMFRKET